jgi:ankyrin repeat protein
MNALIAHLPDLKDLPDKVRTHIHPVFDAVRCPYPHAAIAFLAAWGRMNTRDDDGRTPLMICSNVGIAQHLINSGIRVDDVDNHGMTALHYACMLGRADLVSFLLMRGADASALDSKGRTALHMALDMNHVLAIIALFSSEHSSMEWIDTCDQHGITALHTAVKKDLCDIVACLLAAGAKQTPNGIGKTPLHLARSSFVARILLEAGAKDVKDVNGYTALMYACEKGERALVAVLSRRKYGCDVNAVNNKGETALSLAYEHSVLYAFPTLLLSPLVDVNLWKNEEGCTLLNLAATSYYPETVERLLAAGADPMIEDDYGDIPLTVVREEESMQLLIEAAPYSVYHSHFHGRTMLMRMCARMDMESLNQLFLSCSEHDVTIEIDEIDDSGDSALDIAMMILHSECVQELLCKGAEVLGTGWQDMTVLMKPFLDHDDELTEIHYRDIRLLRDESEDDKDLMTQRCLELVLSQLHRKLTFPTMWTPRTGTVKRRDGGRGPPAKRRRK